MKITSKLPAIQCIALVGVIVTAFWFGLLASWIMAHRNQPTTAQVEISNDGVETDSAGEKIRYSNPLNHDNFIIPVIEPQISPDYPQTQLLIDILGEWNPDHPEEQPSPFVETLQAFNYSNPEERAVAERYRNAEVPFKIYDIPDLDEVIHKWTDDYLSSKFRKNSRVHVERSTSNHFMYWTNRKGRKGDWSYTPPTEHVSMKFDDWLARAHQADTIGLQDNIEHYYFMVGTAPGEHRGHFVADDLPFFSTKTKNFFITNVPANKGIQCRFGMRGIIAEAHYDSGRNFVAMLKGAKRYILAAPSECERMNIIKDTSHPSFRHSVVDWSNLDEVRTSGLGNAQAIDTIVRQGEMLYIPSFWFHYIISLQYSIQCNSRSGIPPRMEGRADIDKCLGVKLNLESYNQPKQQRLRTSPVT